ncbi:hypothetical protein Acr_12g0004630 [Actinidia rufa]|uniref:Uncharacterized protein n=1 Tax=Actinidia rufa TaxID=165716 RepID=A0A7J0FGU9_9ERIC|nr:hypothetical protein Acr_12g0004630 [Actinidia rufa]
MGLSDDGVKGESWDVGKSKSKKKKDGVVEDTGCWVRLRCFGSCISSRSKVDSSVSGISTHCEEMKKYWGHGCDKGNGICFVLGTGIVSELRF